MRLRCQEKVIGSITVCSYVVIGSERYYFGAARTKLEECGEDL